MLFLLLLPTIITIRQAKIQVEVHIDVDIEKVVASIPAFLPFLLIWVFLHNIAQVVVSMYITWLLTGLASLRAARRNCNVLHSETHLWAPHLFLCQLQLLLLLILARNSTEVAINGWFLLANLLRNRVFILWLLLVISLSLLMVRNLRAHTARIALDLQTKIRDVL